MILSLKVIELLRVRCGNDLRLPSDVEALALDIEAVTKEHVGVNTLKRLLGFINDEREPRISTLDIVAHYLGYSNWDVLQQLDSGSNSNFGNTTDTLDLETLQAGRIIQVSYQPNRRVFLEYQGDNRFLVIESVNSKLRKGDLLETAYIVNGYPLLATNVIRNGENLGNFTAGKAQGITYKIL